MGYLLALILAVSTSIDALEAPTTRQKKEKDRPTYEKPIYESGVKTNRMKGKGIVWDFEDGLQGWTHTNGQAFPAGWDVEPSGYKPAYTPPDAGDSCMWIDSDAGGNGFWIQDTALSPVVVPPVGMAWLKYGLGFESGSGSYLNDLYVGIQTFSGGAWNSPVQLKYYPNGTDYLGWDSVDVSAYNTDDSIRVYFYYDDLNTWGYYAAFDNVGLLEPLAHDVEAVSIDVPAPAMPPDVNFTPTATFRNNGANPETFDVYYKMDSAGVNLYDETTSLTLNPTDDSTVQFLDFTPSGPGIYFLDITVYTVLTGDEVPGNDTLLQQTVVSSYYWEILTAQLPMANSGHSEATADDGTYMVFGIGYDSTLIYDINSNVWIGGPNNPYGDGYYGTAEYVNGKYYRIGGYDGANETNRIDIYDPVLTTWAAGATAPVAIIDHASGVYNDSLIFCLGGGNWFSGIGPNTGVYFYDTYNDSWTACDTFPGPGRGCLAGGVIDSFAIVACGYDGTAMRIDYIVGNIDPTNPATINWGTAQNIPGIDSLYRIPCGVDKYNKELWLVCGQKWTTRINGTWSYSPYTDIWTDWNMPKPQVVANVTPIVITTTVDGDLGVFVAGGHDGVDVTDHEVFHTGNTSGISEELDKESYSFGFISFDRLAVPGYATITYETKMSGHMTLKVYDLMGRTIKTLVDRPKEIAGRKSVYWNYEDDNHNKVANGVYILRLTCDGMARSGKMVVIR